MYGFSSFWGMNFLWDKVFNKGEEEIRKKIYKKISYKIKNRIHNV